MARWPDVEALTVAHLAAVLSGTRVGTKVPGTLPAKFVRVTRGPGGDDGLTDAPIVDVEAFAGTQPAASQLAEDAREAMHALRNRVVGGSLVDTVDTATGPVRVDWGNPAVERYVASYRVTLRKNHT